jgi:hypothetical protein
MPIQTKIPQSNTSPSSGGHAFDLHNNTSGSDSFSISDIPGGSSTSSTGTCRWSNFQPVSGQITQIRVKFDWSLSGSLDVEVNDNGSADASYSMSIGITGAGGEFRSDGIGINGPGPVFDHRNIDEGGSLDQVIAPGTPINTIQIEVALSITTDSGLVGSSGIGSANINFNISNIRIEVITVDDFAVCCGMM